MGLMFLLKNLFNRPRPEIPLIDSAKGLSFPSGHALMSVTFYGLLIYMTYKSVKRKEITTYKKNHQIHNSNRISKISGMILYIFSQN
jgi:membrane-associated phospholipid phosphatase